MEVAWRLLWVGRDLSTQADAVADIHIKLKDNVKRGRAPNLTLLYLHIADEFAGTFTLDRLSSVAGCEKGALNRCFRDRFGISPMRWLWLVRIAVARILLQRVESSTVTDVATACGFSSLAHFSRLFRQVFGMAPRTFRRYLAHNHEGEIVPRIKIGGLPQANRDWQNLVITIAANQVCFLNHRKKVRRRATS